jgi:hypothetical protein
MRRSQLIGAAALVLSFAAVARADELPEEEPADPPVAPPPVAPAPVAEPVDFVTINGGFWLNYTYNLFDPTDRDKVGDFGPGNSMFRIGFDAKRKGFLGSVRLRWYSYARVWEYGWVGYRWENGAQLEVGLTKVPFGVLPYGVRLLVQHPVLRRSQQPVRRRREVVG